MKNLGAIIFMMLATLVSAQTETNKTAFSLTEAQEYAVANNDSLALLQLDVTKAEKQVMETRAIGLPQVSGELSLQYFFDIPTQLLPDFISPAVYGVLMQEGLIEPKQINTGDMVATQFGTDYNIKAGVNVNQLIFDGQYIVALRASRTYKSLSRTMLNTSTINIRANVAKLYMQTLVLNETVGLLESNQEQLNKSITEMTAMLKEGLADELDLDRLVLAKQRIDHQTKIIGRTHEVVKLLLKLQMGYPVENDIELTDQFDMNLELADNSILSETANPSARPEYKTLEVNRELQELDMQRYQAGYIPQLVGFFSYSQNALVNEFDAAGDGDNWFPTTVGGVSLNVPVFDGLTKAAKIQQAKIEMEKADVQMEQFSESVKMQVMSQQNSYLNAQESFEIEKLNMELAKKIYDRAKIKYDEGMGSSLEMTTALTDYYTAQSAFVDASYKLITAKINLEKALGKYN
ncbi:MAG: TolC family protein [Bacteroidetes bacterium]|nr:TolC family protein [Bacteroidota bacterium]